MPAGQLRKLAPPTTTAASARPWKSFLQNATPRLVIISGTSPQSAVPSKTSSRSLAQIRPEAFSEAWFTSARPVLSPADELLSPRNPNDPRPPDERTLKLGKTLRILSPLLPNILTTPLPPEILSPSIVLHLFPSTHPHLPSVRGKVPYRATLWTAPVAWGSVPIVGNVKLRILSEKIVRTGYVTTPQQDDAPEQGEEKLVVRWKTEGNPSQPSTAHSTTAATSTASGTNGNGGVNRGLSKLLGGDKPIFHLSKDAEFSGLFIFTFDSEGRIVSHTIEHADENNGCDKTSRVVTLTDWLLGKARGKVTHEGDMVPGLAMRSCRDEWVREKGRGSGW